MEFINNNYIFSGENLEGDLLYLKSLSSNANIHIETNNIDVKYLYGENTIKVVHDNIEHSIDFNYERILDTIEYVDSSLIEFIKNGTIIRTLNLNPGNIEISDETNIWISKNVFGTLGDLQDRNPSTLEPNNLEKLENNLTFMDGYTTSSLSCVGFEFQFGNGLDVILGSFQMYENQSSPLYTYPEILRIFGRKGDKWIEIFHVYGFEKNKLYDITGSGFLCSRFALIVETFQTQTDIETLLDKQLRVVGVNTEEDTDTYRLQIGSVKFYSAKNVKYNYDFNMDGGSIANVDTLSLNRLIFNNKLFTELVTKEDLAEIDFNLKDYTTPTIFRSLVKPQVHIDIDEIENLIPIYRNNNGVDSLFDYKPDISTKYLEQLNMLSRSNQDGILFQNSLGDLYKSFTLNSIDINTINTVDIIVENNINISNIIILNNESIEWKSDTLTINHGNIPLQNHILDKSYRIPIFDNVIEHNVKVIRDPYTVGNEINIDNNIVEYEYTVGGKRYILRQPHGGNIAVGTVDDIPEVSLIREYVKNGKYFESFNIMKGSDNVIKLELDGIPNIPSYGASGNSDRSSIFYFENEEGFRIHYMDFIEYEFDQEIILRKISFGIYNRELIRPPDKFYILTFDEIANKWINLRYIDNYEKLFDRELIFNVDSIKKYKKYRIAIEKLNVRYYTDSDGVSFVDELSQYCGFSRLQFYGLFEDNKGDVLISNEISKMNMNSVNINNWMEGGSMLVVNDDIEYSGKTESVVHVNGKAGENSNLLRLMVIQEDPYKLDQIQLTNRVLNTVVHGIDVEYNTTYYKIGITNEENENVRDVLRLSRDGGYVKDGCVGINIDNNEMRNDGLIVRPSLVIKSEKDILGNSGHVDIRTDVSVVDTYSLILPPNKGELNQFLQIYNVDNDKNIINTKWTSVTQDVFLDNNMYFGGSDTCNVFNMYPEFEYYNNGVNENMVHARKMLIGKIEDVDETSYKNVINNYSTMIVGKLYTTEDVTTDSDKSYKSEFKKLDNVRNKIEALNGYTYEHVHGDPDRRYCGLIAQDVEKVLPESVCVKHDNKLRLMYNSLSALYVEGLKDLYKEIDEIKRELLKR